MKFYNLGNKTFETDIRYHQQNPEVNPSAVNSLWETVGKSVANSGYAYAMM